MQRASLARTHGSLEEELKQLWARQMKELLLSMKAEVERAKAVGQHAQDALVLAHFLRSSDEILTEGDLANPPPPAARSRNIRSEPQGEPNKALLGICWIVSSSGKWAVLRFLHDFAVPFDNNQAERDLRMSHPCSKRSLAVSAPKRGSPCFVVFALPSRLYANKGLGWWLHSIKPFRVIPFLHDPPE
jgi:hypothetical protein